MQTVAMPVISKIESWLQGLTFSLGEQSLLGIANNNKQFHEG